MSDHPLERVYGNYSIILRKSEHVNGRPTPHVEIWKGKNKVGNYDMATGRPIFKKDMSIPTKIQNSLSDYLNDPQVKEKIKSMIKQSFFDLSKPIGEYGGIPKVLRPQFMLNSQNKHEKKPFDCLKL